MHSSLSPTSISLSRNEIHLWLIDEQAVEKANVLQDYPAVISTQESQRLSGIKSSKRKQQFLITRVALRLILSFYLDHCAPIDIRFTTNKFGKPALKDNVDHLNFNVSHTDGKILIGIAKQRALGVDIERMSKKRNIAKIAKHYFHSKEWDINLMEGKVSSNDERMKRFYKLWTLKEAFIKAEGRGLFLPLDSFYFEDCDSPRPQLAVDSSASASALTKRWQLEQTFLASNYSLSVAFEEADPAAVVHTIARDYVPLRAFSPINLF